MIFQNAYISAEIRRNGQLSSSLERLIETSWRNIASHHCNNVEHLPTGPEENSFDFPRVQIFPETSSRVTLGLLGKQN